MTGTVIKDYSKYEPEEGVSPWIKFDEGTTTIRLLSHSYNFKSHYVPAQKKSFDCTGDGSTCEWCQKMIAPRGRWAYLVLTRGEKPEVKVMECGWSIFGTILDLAKDEDYGEPRGYDIKVKRTGTNLETKYTVIPGKDKKFTKEEVLAIGSNDDVDKATDKLMSYYKKDDGKEENVEENFDEVPF